MTTKQRYQAFVEHFQATMPNVTTELHYDNPFQLLVAVMLSAQCTDARVNTVTPALFAALPTPEAMAQSTPEEIFRYIKSVSYPNSKASHLYETACKLVDDYGSEVPDTREALMSLKGVGRKTANVILAVLFHQATMPVDTHVFRVAERIGLTTGSTTPLTTERTLLKYLPAGHVADAHHWLILHGRYTCTARKPDCPNCTIKSLCRYFLHKCK